MRVLKFGIISLFLLAVLVTLISFLFPSHLRLSKATNLPNDRQRIFALLKNDTAWHPAYKDTATTKTFLLIKKSLVEQTDSTFVLRLQGGDRKPVISGWRIYGAPATDSLTLQWYMDFQLGPLPWQKFSSLFYENTYGAMMEKGLANIKEEMKQ